MARIEVLPPGSHEMLIEVRDHWIAVGLNCTPANRGAAEEGVRMAYKAADMKAPKKMVWLGSPLAGAIGAAIHEKGGDPTDIEGQRKLKIKDEEVRDLIWRACYGQHDAGWLAFYDAMARLGVKEAERLGGLSQVSRNAGWWWPYEDIVILTERPLHINRDERLLLHGESGPAVAYPDGFDVFAWHGLRVPPTHRQYITDPETITAEAIHNEVNQELRRFMMEKIGVEKYAALAGVKEIQQDDFGTLYKTEHQAPDSAIAGEVLAMARVVCPSTDREYWLRVPPTMTTAREAIAWTYDVPADEYEPTAET